MKMGLHWKNNWLPFGLALFFLLKPCFSFELDKNEFYIGGGGYYANSEVFNKLYTEQSSISGTVLDRSRDRENTALATHLTGGYRINKYINVESSFISPHEYNIDFTNTVEEDQTSNQFTDNLTDHYSLWGLSFTAISSYAFSPRFLGFARLGLTRWQIEESGTWVSGVNSAVSKSSYNKSHAEVNYVAGIGARYIFGVNKNIEFRAEVQQYQLGSTFSNNNDSTIAISSGLLYHFGKKAPKVIAPVIPRASLNLSDVSAAEGEPLVFNIQLSEPVKKDIVLDVAMDAKAMKLNMSALEKVAAYRLASQDEWQAMDMTKSVSLILPAGQTEMQIRLNTETDFIQIDDRKIKLSVKSLSDQLKTQQVLATGTIIENGKAKPVMAKTENIPVVALPPVIPPPVDKAAIAAFETAVPQVPPPVSTQLKKELDGEEAVSIVTLNAAEPQVVPKKRVFPMVRPFDENNATPREKAVSGLLWNDVKAYNDFDGESPVLLPAIALVESIVPLDKVSQRPSDNYEDAEEAAREGNASVAIWGNVLQFGDKMYLESHLSLVDEPVELEVVFNTEKKSSVTFSVPRTRFAFALKELSDQNIKRNKLITLSDVKIHKKASTRSEEIAILAPGVVAQGINTFKEWYEIEHDNKTLGWVHASKVAVVPTEVYVQSEKIDIYQQVNDRTSKTIESPIQALKVRDVKQVNKTNWFQLQIDAENGWVDSKLLKPKPFVPMTEFLVAIQHFQRQDFENATKALTRFINSVENQFENNVSLSTAYQMLAISFMQQGMWNDAVNTLDKAVALTKYDPSVFNFKAIALLGQQFNAGQRLQLIEIAKNLENALYLEPDDALAKRIVEVLNTSLQSGTGKVTRLDIDSKDKQVVNQLFRRYQQVVLN